LYASWGSHKDAKLALPDVSEDQYQPVSMNKYYRQFDNEKIVQIAAGCDHSAVLTGEFVHLSNQT
jgi:alpha-tubulin suppressor-like RCC1 family protein